MGLERNYGLQAVHVAAIVFAALHLAFTGLTAVVGLFANGATPWERILISGVHPLAAALVAGGSGNTAGYLHVVCLGRRVSVAGQCLWGCRRIHCDQQGSHQR